MPRFGISTKLHIRFKLKIAKSKLTELHIRVTPKIQNIKIAYQKEHYWSYHEATQTRGQKQADKRALHKSTHIKGAFDKSAHNKRVHDFY